uniref:Uncharacterized protein n=1 Tax=Pyxicephalus adspersus TaxID=30357 RepID=A0AAV3AZR4_PYXAD|nr:TPA: hypothetical protein GDO54_008208 [Pyxicephalus adspersus]
MQLHHTHNTLAITESCSGMYNEKSSQTRKFPKFPVTKGQTTKRSVGSGTRQRFLLTPAKIGAPYRQRRGIQVLLLQQDLFRVALM